MYETQRLGTILTGTMQQRYFTVDEIDQANDAKRRIALELENLKRTYGYRITAAAALSKDKDRWMRKDK